MHVRPGGSTARQNSMVLHPGMTDEDMLASGLASVLTRPRAAAQCRELGCLYKQGVFVCEFHSAKTNKKKDATSDSAIRTEVISGEAQSHPSQVDAALPRRL